MFLSVTESHVSEEIKDEELKIENYTLYRTDRRNRTDGGVVLYLRHDIASSAKVLCSHLDGTNELLIIKVPTVNMLIVSVSATK